MSSVLAVLVLLLISSDPESQSVAALKLAFQDPIQASSIRQIDFANLNFYAFGEKGSHEPPLRLRHGLFKSHKRYELTEVKLKKVWYFGSEKAIAAFDFFSCGGSCSDESIIQLFELRDGHLRIIQQLEYDLQAPGTGERFDAKTGELFITARADDGSAHCCPENVDHVRFRWNGRQFVQISSRRVRLPPGTQR
jgi:hypothetical protein